MAFSDLWTTVKGYFGGIPGDTSGAVSGEMFVGPAQPQWEEINRVIESAGKTEEVARVVSTSEARDVAPTLAYTFQQTVVEPLKKTAAGLPGFFQTTLSKILLGVVAIVVGLLLLNIFLARSTR